MPDNQPMPARAQLVASPPRRQASPADPCALVIFGATGDLTKRLVVPALYNLSLTKVLPEKFALIGVARADGTAESWRDHLYDMLKSFVGNPAGLAAVKMDFRYDDWFPKEPNVGYETLLYDVMIGDPTLFVRADMVEQAWRVVQPVLDDWAAGKVDFPDYASGSDGPKAADALLARDGERAWRPVGPAPQQKP